MLRSRDSIGAHLAIVFAAPAVTRFIQGRTGWSIKKFVRTARRYRTVQIPVSVMGIALSIIGAQKLPPSARTDSRPGI